MPELLAEQMERSFVLDAAVEPDRFAGLVDRMCGVDGISGVKIGMEVGLAGLRDAVEVVADIGLSAIYDHQAAGAAGPEVSEAFLRSMKRARVTAAILYPIGGPEAQRRWTDELQDAGIHVIVGAEMAHLDYRATSSNRSGGYVTVTGDSIARTLEIAIKHGGRNFALPSNSQRTIKSYRNTLDAMLGRDKEQTYTLWTPGLVTLESLAKSGRDPAPRVASIVGSEIYASEDPHQAAIAIGQQALANEYSR
jgi:hypothetical protein